MHSHGTCDHCDDLARRLIDLTENLARKRILVEHLDRLLREADLRGATRHDG